MLNSSKITSSFLQLHAPELTHSDFVSISFLLMNENSKYEIMYSNIWHVQPPTKTFIPSLSRYPFVSFEPIIEVHRI